MSIVCSFHACLRGNGWPRDVLEMALRLATELLANNQRNDGLGNRLHVETYV